MGKAAIRTRKRALLETASEQVVVNRINDNLRLQIRYVNPQDLKPPERKLRRHSTRQLQLIAASVREHGFLNPLVINSEGRIICGHGRWLATIDLRLELVPVIELDHLSPEQLRIYAIAENRLGDLSEFDMDELRIEFSELEGISFDLNLELSGFSTSEIDDLVLRAPTDKESEQVPKIEGPAITVVGDLWQLGDHLLLCGDALEAASYENLMQDEKAGVVFTDPPYNVPSRAISGRGQHLHRDFAMAAGEMSQEEFTHFISTYSQHLVAFSVDGSIHFQCMDWHHIGEMMAGGRHAYSELKNLIVWAKHSAGMGTFYRSQHELIFAWKAGTAPHVNNFGLGETGRHRSNVWSYKGNAGFHRDRNDELSAHPTVKPLSLVADAIRDCSRRGAIVLDPFGGYGTTMIAAERTRRRARLIELDPHYCDATIRRWETFTGKTAILLATGQTLAEVAEARGIVLGNDDDGEETDPDDEDFGEDG